MANNRKITGGNWNARFWATDDDPEKLRKLGLEPIRNLTNDGQVIVVNDEGRVALVDPVERPKRGQGHRAICEERDRRALLIAAAPDFKEAARLALAGNMAMAKTGDEYVAIPRAAYDALQAAYKKSEG